MLRSKMLMTILAAAALGAGTGWAFSHSLLPGKTWATVETEAPPPATSVPAGKAEPSESAQYLIRIDGERSELRFGGKDAGLDADKDGVSLRTSLGKFELRW